MFIFKNVLFLKAFGQPLSLPNWQLHTRSMDDFDAGAHRRSCARQGSFADRKVWARIWNPLLLTSFPSLPSLPFFPFLPSPPFPSPLLHFLPLPLEVGPLIAARGSASSFFISRFQLQLRESLFVGYFAFSVTVNCCNTVTKWPCHCSSVITRCWQLTCKFPTWWSPFYMCRFIRSSF